MVAAWRMKMIRESIVEMERAVAANLHIAAVKFPLERIKAQIEALDFDQPTAADENEAELDTAVKDAEPEFTFQVGWYMGEEWIEATGKDNCVVDALGELCGAVEQATRKELDRQRIADERAAAADLAEVTTPTPAEAEVA